LKKTAICFCSCLKITQVLFDKETRVSMSADVKGDACERLLDAVPAHPCARGIGASCASSNTRDTRSGAGLFLTPHSLIQVTA